MPHFIIVTIPGGEYGGPKEDIPTYINIDKIIQIKQAKKDDENKAVIKLDSGISVKTLETPLELLKLIDKIQEISK